MIRQPSRQYLVHQLRNQQQSVRCQMKRAVGLCNSTSILQPLVSHQTTSVTEISNKQSHVSNIQVAQLWQRERTNLAILNGLVTLRLNFRLKCYISCQSLWTLDGGILQLCTEIFHRKKLCSRLKFNFIQKTNKSLFEPLFGGPRRHVRTPSIAHWEALRRLAIHHNSTSLLSLMVKTLQAEIWRLEVRVCKKSNFLPFTCNRS